MGLRFVAKDESLTPLRWSALLPRAAAVAGGLRADGVRPGDTVALIFPTSPAFFHAFFGVLLAGGIPVPLYPPVRLGRLDEYHARTEAMLRAARVGLVLTEDRVWRILGETVARAGVRCRVVDTVDGPPLVHAAAPDDLALVQFSSGTTVDPKPVALSHANILANVRAILAWMFGATGGFNEEGVSWLPLYHDMGLIGGVCPALFRPGTLTLIPPELFIARPAVWLRTLSRTGAAISPAPNFAYALCADRIRDAELDGVDLSAWRFALNGAEPVAPETLRRFVARFARWGFRPEALTPVYGLAEASLAVTFSPADDPFYTARFDRDALGAGRVVPHPDGVELVSVGVPLDEVRVEAAADVVGPIRVQGPSVMTGYLFQPERTAAAISDGWLDTGDLGFRHEGRLYVTGRVKDLLILRGRNHAPHEVEQAVDPVDGVRTGCAAAVSYRPEGAEEEQLVVFVEVRPDAPSDVSAACQRAVLAATGLSPSAIVPLAPGTLPRTSSGKIRRAEALARWLRGELTPPERVTPWLLAGALFKGTLAHWRAS